MKFSLSWLKEHLDTQAPLDTICEKLTAIGLEVEGLEDHGKALEPFIVAEIMEAEQHPQADRLRVCKVNTGKEIIQVVCGAPNARKGLKTVLARPGDVIPETGEPLKLSKIRGIESQGMMCAADELCLGDEHDGILELGADAPVGGSFVDYAKLKDAIIEINLTPNRGDCAGVRGVARDLAAAGIGTLKPRKIEAVKGEGKSKVGVTVDDAKGCPLFVGRTISGIKNGPSPDWLQKKLRDIGQKPISALVDITNYLCFDSARPLHVFDVAKLKGDLWVRPAKGGEEIVALNDKTYTLEAGMIAIGDEAGVQSIAGVMGGAATGCDADTTTVFLESALFDSARIAKTGRALQVTSDARYRFERGVDPAFVQDGAELATKLILECCGTPETKVSELVVVGAVPEDKITVDYKPSLCLKRLGVDVSAAEQERILTTLGFAIEKKGDAWRVTAPSWRPDIGGPDDLTEEVIRIYGFDKIPALSMPRLSAVTETAIDALDRKCHFARRALAGLGLNEAVTWSFMPEAIAAATGWNDPALKLLNPISADLDVMRPSIIGNLAMAAGRNAARGIADVGLFEVGPVFKSAGDEGESFVACALRAGATPRHWGEKARAVDCFDAKADAIAALAACGAPAASLQVSTDAPSYYHPGRSGALRLGPKVLAFFGELHPEFLDLCKASGPVVACEIFLEAIPAARSTSTAKPLLKMDALQPVTRDFAFVVESGVSADQLIKAIKSADKVLIRDVSVFDLYEGKNLGEGKKSVALSVTLQPVTTLTEAELEAFSGKVKAAVEKATGAVLRG